jgi:NAD(P)-dependent dehydrogenase (short-subunit alcohol dehydrogenase family)
MNLSGKVAVVTGGARMGSAIGRALGAQGCSLIFTYRKSRDSADEAVAELKKLDYPASALPCDVSDGKSVRTLIEQIIKDTGHLDILVNLASVYAATDLLKDSEFKDWDKNISANAKSAYMLSAAAAPVMKKTGGRIIHISDWTSASGRPRYEDYVPYYVSKVAVKGIVEAMALAFAPEVLVNAIAPGPILAPAGMTAEEDKAVREATPLKRWGGPEEIARAVVFLAETDFVTGETIRVDGGRHLN